MDYDSEIKHIQEKLKEHDESLGRHRKDISDLQKNSSLHDRKMDELYRKVTSMETDQKEMKEQMSDMQKQLDAVQNQGALLVKAVAHMTLWQKITIIAVIAIIVAIFIAGGEFKKSFLESVLMLLPAAK